MGISGVLKIVCDLWFSIRTKILGYGIRSPVIKHFNHFLYGCSFVVFTDHRPLTSLMSSKALNRRIHGDGHQIDGT